MAYIRRDAYLVMSDYDVSLKSSFQRNTDLGYHCLCRPEKAAATGKSSRSPGISRFLVVTEVTRPAPPWARDPVRIGDLLSLQQLKRCGAGRAMRPPGPQCSAILTGVG